MIFIITHKQDYTVDFVIDKLNKRSIKYSRFNCEDIDKKGYQIHIGEINQLLINHIDSIDSIWFRRTKLPDLENVDSGEKLFLLKEYDSLLSNLYYLLSPKKWLSFPPNVYKAENKLLQLKIAQNLGFIIPDTIVTNNISVLKSFAVTHNNSIVIKPLSSGRITKKDGIKNIFTNKIDHKKLNEIEKYYLTPSIIQPYIEKEYEIRVTIVGEKVFSARVDSQINVETQIDWRRGKTKFEPYLLPCDIENKCIDLLKSLDISFGAIDLIKSTDGSYIFLEINPNGQWAWIESDTKQDISDEIINYLTL